MTRGSRSSQPSSKDHGQPSDGAGMIGPWVQDELVLRAQRGDAEAFDSLARMVGARCLAIAVRILRDIDVAEDAVQAAMIMAWTELRALRDPSRFEPWLHRILTHACWAEARHRRRWYAGRGILGVTGAYGPDDYLTVDDRDLLERALRRLTSQQRSVMVFHHYLGLSISEVAGRAGIPVGTAKSRLHHATRALRASIEADARASTVSQGRPA